MPLPTDKCIRVLVLLARYLTDQWTVDQTLVDDVIEGTDERIRFFQGHTFWRVIAAGGGIRHPRFGVEVSSSSVATSVVSCLALPSAVLAPRLGHTMHDLSPSDSIFCVREDLVQSVSGPLEDVIHPRCFRSASFSRSWHCSLHYLLL